MHRWQAAACCLLLRRYRRGAGVRSASLLRRSLCWLAGRLCGAAGSSLLAGVQVNRPLCSRCRLVPVRVAITLCPDCSRAFKKEQGQALPRSGGAAVAPGLVNSNKNVRSTLSPPVATVSVAVYTKDVKVTRSLTHKKSRGPRFGCRSTINKFSGKSLANLKFKARNLSHTFRYMLTLTYPASFPLDGRKVKSDWTRMRYCLLRRKIAGLWVLEFTEKGTPHIHILLTASAKTIFKTKAWISETWARIADTGNPKHLLAGTQIIFLREAHAGAAYVSAYASKLEQKQVPETFGQVGRFWGLFGGLQAVKEAFISGAAAAVAPLVRALRKHCNQLRRSWGYPPKRDNGLYGFTAVGCSMGAARYVDAYAVPYG